MLWGGEPKHLRLIGADSFFLDWRSSKSIKAPGSKLSCEKSVCVAVVANLTNLVELPTSESLCVYDDDGVVLLVSAFDSRAVGDTDL